MSASALTKGRVNQKQRTRRALLEAAARLLQQGQTPTVADAADAAQVSRATAYRYFTSPDQLQFEAALELTTPQIEARIAATTVSAQPAARVDAVVSAVHAIVAANEAAFRSMLRHTLAPAEPQSPGDDSVAVRGGRRVQWIAAALEPLRETLGPERFARLVAGLALCVGIESVVVLKDVCGLDTAASEEITRWVAQALLAASLAETTAS